MTPWNASPTSAVPTSWNGTSTTESRESRALATELKFLVTPDLARQIRDWARTHLAADPHGAGPADDEYRTHSLYFDNDALDVFHRRGSYGRANTRAPLRIEQRHLPRAKDANVSTAGQAADADCHG